jgi:hypothetical protein
MTNLKSRSTIDKDDMAKKNKSTPTATPAAAAVPATVQLASTASQVQPPSSKPKMKKKKGETFPNL